MQVGELFVALGVKKDASWNRGVANIKAMAQLAKQKAREMAAAAREASREQVAAARAASRAVNAALRSEAQAARSAAREMAAAAREASREQVAAARVAARAANAALRSEAQAARQAARAAAQADRSAWAHFRVGARGAVGAMPDWLGTGNPFSNVKDPKGRGGRGGRGGRKTPQGESFGGLKTALAATGLFSLGSQFGDLADTYANLQNRLRLVTSSQSELNATFERLRVIARNTRSGLEPTIEGYVRIKNATSELKLSQGELFTLTERINQALATSGASTAEASAGFTQLSQALAKGKLDGDEFKSIAENMPNILKLLEKSLGVTEGRLRQMSRAGELTRAKIVKAFLDPSNGLKAALDKTKPTFGSSWQKFRDDLTVTFGRLAQDKDLVRSFSQVLDGLAWSIKALTIVLTPIIGALGDFVQGLKDGKWWAYGLAAVLGANLIPSLAGIAKWVVGFPLARLAAIRAALGLGGAAGTAAAGATATSSAGGASAGALGLLGPVGWSLLGAYALSEATGGPMDILSSDFYDHPESFLRGKYGASSSETKNITINVGGVSIKSSTVEDGANEAIDRAMRHAAHAF